MIYHIAESQEWHPQSPYMAPSLAQEGFIHASSWSQLPRIGRSLFAERTDVVVLEIDSELLDAAPVWEDLYELSEEFPHVYGEIAYRAVTATLNLSWSAGSPLFRLSGADYDTEALRLEPVDQADSGAISELARMNGQLIEDELLDLRLSSSELEERMERFLAGQYTGYMLYTGDTCCGYALIDHEREPAYLRHYFVRRGLRRTGIGSAGVKLIQTMIAGEIDIHCLLHNRRGIRFWHKMGFADRAVSMRLPTTPDTTGRRPTKARSNRRP